MPRFSHWSPPWLSEAHHQEGPEAEWFGRTALRVRPEAASHVAGEFSWVPSLLLGPAQHRLPNKVSCLSAWVSLDNGFLSVGQESALRPWKGSFLSCNRTNSPWIRGTTAGWKVTVLAQPKGACCLVRLENRHNPGLHCMQLKLSVISVQGTLPDCSPLYFPHVFSFSSSFALNNRIDALALSFKPYPKAGIWGTENAQKSNLSLCINFPETLTWLLLFTCHWSELVISSSQKSEKVSLPGTWCPEQS